MLRVPCGRVTLCDSGWQWRKDSGGKTTSGGPTPDDAAALWLRRLADFAPAVTAPAAAAPPFTADETPKKEEGEKARPGAGVEIVSAAAPDTTPDPFMADEALKGAEVKMVVEVVTATAPDPNHAALGQNSSVGPRPLRGSERGEVAVAEGMLLLLPTQRVEVEAAPHPPPPSSSQTAAEAAVLLLLELRQGSVATPLPQPGRVLPLFQPVPKAVPTRRASPNSSLEGVKRRGIADTASRFTCRHPGCGKAYSCPDAVRKHCRREHQDWLRRLAYGAPSQYCTWEAPEHL